VKSGIDDPEEQRRVEEKEWPKYDAIITYNNEQLRRELLRYKPGT
jgi:hypothetical protein